jgi:hypothetical protein
MTARLQALPFDPAKLSRLSPGLISSHHQNNYGGVVKRLNAIRNELGSTASPPTERDAWIADEPTGQYARRAGFFYEYLTGRQLDFPGVMAGNYVSALDEEIYVTSSQSTNNQRWRVRDNLPGTRAFCPTVLRLPAVRQAEQ